MKRFLITRLAQLFIVFLGVSFFTYALTIAVPYSAVGRGGEGTSFLLNYLTWLRRIFVGSDQVIMGYRRSAFVGFGQFIPSTVKHACISLLVVVFFSLLLGVLTAVKKDSPFDYVVRFFSFIGTAVPNFVLGVYLILFFSLRLKLLPIISGDDPRGMVLPVIALSTPLISRYVRQVRGAVLEELNQDYVTGAAARGIGMPRIIRLHILPNAMASILSSLGVIIGQLLSGIAIIEMMFVWRGIGSLTVQSIRVRDYTVIQAYVIWMAIFYIVARFIIDVLIYFFDPQLHRKGAA
ncbi:MAG: ABC transporter permease [Clostridiales bacterium]|nr:ABC transporter permease [Clostridiales bacterium]